MSALPERALPLTDAAVGRSFRLVGISGGRQIAHRLVEMGLTPGVTLKLLQNARGPLLVAVRGYRIALGRGMAQKLTVTPE